LKAEHRERIRRTSEGERRTKLRRDSSFVSLWEMTRVKVTRDEGGATENFSGERESTVGNPREVSRNPEDHLIEEELHERYPPTTGVESQSPSDFRVSVFGDW
jgi:hypothetical protein